MTSDEKIKELEKENEMLRKHFCRLPYCNFRVEKAIDNDRSCGNCRWGFQCPYLATCSSFSKWEEKK